MKRWLNELDRILRGEATRLGTLEEGKLRVPLGGLLWLILLLAALYGLCMGFYAGFREGGPCFMQWLAAVVKVPALFLLTLAVTFPSLYVFNALVGSRLSFTAVLRLLVASLAVNVTVLASLGPIVAFFSVSTTSYPFLLLLNVLVFVVAGLLGFAFMLQTLYRLDAVGRDSASHSSRTDSWGEPQPETETKEPTPSVATQLLEQSGALWGVRGYMLDPRVKRVFVFWIIVFGFVCAQMGWVLRPFLGKPDEPFHWFAAREANFFKALWEAFRSLLS
jgi:hypothetical protein